MFHDQSIYTREVNSRNGLDQVRIEESNRQIPSASQNIVVLDNYFRSFPSQFVLFLTVAR